MNNGFGNGTGYSPSAMEYAVAEKRTQIGADWFFWIAGFSLINSVLAMAGAQVHFIIGLGATEWIYGFMSGLISGSAATSKILALAVDILMAGFYVLYGFYARKGAKWAFLTGMIFYALDGALLLLFQSWLSVAFHGYALFRIFQGFQAAQRLGVMRGQAAGQTEVGSLTPPGSQPSSSATPSGDVWPPPPSV